MSEAIKPFKPEPRPLHRQINDPKYKAEMEQKLKKACADFEAILNFQLFKAMRKTIPHSGFMSKSTGKETWELMMDQRVAEELSKKHADMGFQRQMFNQLKKTLEPPADKGDLKKI